MPSVRHLAPAALLVLASACTGVNAPAAAVPDPPTTATAVPSPAVAPTRTPELATVVGERVPGAHWVDSAGLLTHSPGPVGPPDTVLPVVHAVGDWLDAHLDDLQRGGDGGLADVLAPDLLAGATPADLAAVTTELASRTAPVATATYRLDAAYHDSTEWVEATVEVTAASGRRAAATLVFVPHGDGLELVLFGPATEGAT